MENITATKIIDYLTGTGSIKKTDSENTQISKASKFMSSMMLYNYYSKRSGVSVNLFDANTYLDKVNCFLNDQK